MIINLTITEYHMEFLFRPIHRIIQTGVNFILELEKEKKIRDDFIDIYISCVMSDISPVKANYFSQNSHYYHTQLMEWGLKAKNFDPHKKAISILTKTINDGGTISDLLSIFDLFLTIGSIFGLFFLSLSFIEKWHPVISLFFLIFSIILIGYKVFSKLLFYDIEAIQNMNKGLVISQKDVSYGNQYYGKREKIIAAYIWNRSLCSYSTIPAFLILLTFKLIFKVSYTKLKNKMTQVYPSLLSSYYKDKGRVSLSKYFIAAFSKEKQQ